MQFCVRDIYSWWWGPRAQGCIFVNISACLSCPDLCECSTGLVPQSVHITCVQKTFKKRKKTLKEEEKGRMKSSQSVGLRVVKKPDLASVPQQRDCCPARSLRLNRGQHTCMQACTRTLSLMPPHTHTLLPLVCAHTLTRTISLMPTLSCMHTYTHTHSLSL